MRGGDPFAFMPFLPAWEDVVLGATRNILQSQRESPSRLTMGKAWVISNMVESPDQPWLHLPLASLLKKQKV